MIAYLPIPSKPSFKKNTFSTFGQFAKTPWKTENFNNLNEWTVHVTPNSHNNEYQVKKVNVTSPSEEFQIDINFILSIIPIGGIMSELKMVF